VDWLKTTLKKQENFLASMGETILDNTLIQLILNGLPWSYKNTIQTLIHLNVIMTFEQVASNLLIEAHRKQHCTIQLKDEEALAAMFY
jgi:hypothetical protein